MKLFSCGAVIPGCESRFYAETEDALLAVIAEHAARDHAIVEIPPDVVATIRGHVTDG